MIVTIKLKPMDKNDLGYCARKFGLPLPPSVAGMGMHLHTILESVAMRALQTRLDNQDWAIQLHCIQLLSEDNYQHIHTLRVEGTVTDFPKTIAKLIPLFQDVMRQVPQMQPAMEMLEIIGEDLQPTLEQVSFIRDAQKMTKIAGIIVRENREKLCKFFNELLVQKEIPVHITAISVTE